MSGATRFLLLLSTAPLPRFRLHLHRRSFLRFAHLHTLSPATHSLSPLGASRQFHAQTSTEQLGTSHWSDLLNNLSAAGYFHRWEEDELLSIGDLPDGFVRAANACLAFARDRPEILGKLTRRDIEVVVENGIPFLFRNAQESANRIRSFMSGEDSKVLVSDKTHMVDLMRFLVSYASNHIVTSEKNSANNIELVEASVQNLFSELVKFSYSARQQENQFLDGNGQIPEPLGKTIEMKRGDWICPRCTFMNFARNVECRKCEESRPKRQLTGGEWTCPQCDYYNHGKNSVCLRCECKLPGHVTFGHTNSRSGLDYDNERYANNADVDSSRFAANEQKKAQRWSSKVSQLDGISDKKTTIVEGDFPEIMPLRKGVNRFVVSTRKTPLERRLADAQYRRNSGSDDSPDRNDLQNKTVNDNSVISGQRAGANSTSIQYSSTEGSNYVPFVPLPADRFAKKTESPKVEGNEKAMMDDHRIINANATEQSGALSGLNNPDRSGNSIQLSEKPVNQIDSKDIDQEGTEKPERWYKRISELHNVEDLATAIPDDDFPEVMPMRKGENRFVVSNKKDRSLTSPMYKRRIAMEQTNNNNYVPFVPLPADYFAKKNKPQIDGADTTDKGNSETSSLAMQEKVSERPNESRSTIINNNVDKVENQPSTRSRSLVPCTENHTGTSINPQTGYQRKENANEITNPSGTSARPSENQNSRGGSTGKSLEGSAVKEPDPLDMSEEAKAERWFRRVAQIKDISELSQIPDEDFPSIMPMRKGVNRFVVSKRKTPLERRLTSPQYRKNLPVVSSDPPNKENEVI